jgi:hypothetical protein
MRNAIPVLGVHRFDWSGELVVAQMWLDGVTALGAMLAFQMRAFVRRDRERPGVPPPDGPVTLTLIWLMIWLLLAFPYWFGLLFFGSAVGSRSLVASVARGDLVVIAALLVIVLSNVIEESRRGYDRMTDKEIRLEFNWDFSMHLARVSMMMLVAFFLGSHLIVVLALALSYVEIYPMRALRVLGGDYTLDRENEARSRD